MQEYASIVHAKIAELRFRNGKNETNVIWGSHRSED
jgi:hypothetical protein